MLLIVCRKFSRFRVYLLMQLLGKTGEICRIVNPLDDEIPEDVYIIAEDPAPFDPEDEIYVVNLRDLQRHIKNPSAAPACRSQRPS